MYNIHLLSNHGGDAESYVTRGQYKPRHNTSNESGSADGSDIHIS